MGHDIEINFLESFFSTFPALEITNLTNCPALLQISEVISSQLN